MTEYDAKAWIEGRFGSAALARLEAFETLLSAENQRQNLVSRSSLSSLWARHIVDSAQLLAAVPFDGLWIDIGTGGGFPGLVIALVRNSPMILVEPRRQRATFLAGCASTLGLEHVDVRQVKIGAMRGPQAAVVSARAVASIDSLLRESQGVANLETVFVFPRGRSGRDELSIAKRHWRGMFHVKQSITDPDAVIIVAKGVRAA